MNQSSTQKIKLNRSFLLLILTIVTINIGLSQVYFLTKASPEGTWQSISALGELDGVFYYSFDGEVKKYVNNSWEDVNLPMGEMGAPSILSVTGSSSIWAFGSSQGGDFSNEAGNLALFTFNNNIWTPLSLPSESSTKNWTGVNIYLVKEIVGRAVLPI